MSTVKVNTVDKRTGGTLTLGGCGTTVTLGAGATQSGFGRTGTVDWCTTAKTAPFTGVSGNGYFVNTTSGVVTVTLPATPSAGDIISIADYASTFQTNNLTLCRNSSKINGECFNATLNTEGQSITLVYVDATRGWKNTMDSTSNVSGAAYVTATGGTITCCGDYKIHTFTADGCFSVSCAGNPVGSTTVDYLVVAGGAGGGRDAGAGGGAGGYRESKNPAAPWTASPLASGTSLPVSVTTYPITVGGGGSGGAGPTVKGCNGNNSIFSTITSAGGGGGGSGGSAAGCSGGSGGGGRTPGGGPGAGNTPPVSPPQGNNGGTGTNPGTRSSGGGGAGGVGTSGSPSIAPGGVGLTTSISATPTAYAGGAGGSSNCGPIGSSASTCGTGGSHGQNGTTNRGGGGGGEGVGDSGTAGSGGSGIVIIRYKYQ
jgi:hypothetical protein